MQEGIHNTWISKVKFPQGSSFFMFIGVVLGQFWIKICCKSISHITQLLRNATVDWHPTWNWSWQGMSKTTRRASSTTSAAKERLGTMWDRCWMRQVSWWQRMKRRQSYWMPSLLQSSVLRLALRNPRPWR